MSVETSGAATATMSSNSMSKELELWKERYFVERKSRKLIVNWVLCSFGYDVKVEYDKVTGEFKIQGFENKEAMKTAAIPSESSETGIRAVLMDGKIGPEDYDEDVEDFLLRMDSEDSSGIPSDLITTAVSLAEVQTLVGGSEIQQQVSTQGVQQQSSTGVSGSVAPVSGGNSTQQFQSFDLGGDNNAPEIYFVGGNYDESGVGQPQYFILKSSDNDEMPIHIDYSSIFGNTGPSSGNSELSESKQVYYRILGAPDNQESSSQDHQTPNSTQQKPPAAKRKASKSENPKPKKNSRAKPKSATNDISTNEAENTPNSAASRISLPGDSKSNMSVLKTSEEKNPNAIEFGLTLREKAEIYVRSKAAEALKKSGSGYECSLCPDVKYVYNSYENALTHTKSHFDRKPYKCENCSETFSVQREVLQHRKTAHPKPKNTPVVYSPSKIKVEVSKSPIVSNNKQVNKSSNQKTNQLNVVNPKLKTFACQIEGCEWSYATEVELGWHMKAHQQNRI